MTDGFVKHEGVVSINGVPPHPSNATDSNVCTFLPVTLSVYNTQMHKDKQPYMHTHTNKHKQTYLYGINAGKPTKNYKNMHSQMQHTGPAQLCCFGALTSMGKHKSEK